MAGNLDSNDIDWERLARLEINHRRIGILEILSLDDGRTLSVKEMAAELHCSTSDAYYHLSKLTPIGLTRLAFTLPVRGFIEHFYCLAGHSGDDLVERLELPGGAKLIRHYQAQGPDAAPHLRRGRPQSLLPSST